jgi:NAD(P)-dependent dehydrogenase (short-subunit alcohol dehydrogenase family)
LTKSAALQYAKSGIRINAVAPSVIDTPALAKIRSDDPKVIAQLQHPIGRIGNANEVASAVLWLCSNAASFVTGQTIMIDGGYTAQ